ncbi:hypothetical protein RA086_08185 [Lactiplantibacillus sp. WILCCON 0030]|uniref:Uncharacterized protein n=1 Tax=Lactiplantibacillus brownii TaxID=3069269 RepID=A0ABU1AB41_9LACO|nr:hypothetical protein [Lactiplantibacillus brownii]MDQ7937608.1 hypothetical protein [Lactiplantibacillus brownii]
MKRFKPKNVSFSVAHLNLRQALPNIVVWLILIALLVWLLVK